MFLRDEVKSSKLGHGSSRESGRQLDRVTSRINSSFDSGINQIVDEGVQNLRKTMNNTEASRASTGLGQFRETKMKIFSENDLHLQ